MTLALWDFYEDTYAECKPNYDNDYERIKFIVDNVSDNGSLVLDIGCHIGVISERLKKFNNKVYGIDLSKGALEYAKGRGIQTIHGDFMQKEFDCRFDVIVAGECLEHVFDGDAFLTKIKRLLKPCGKLVLTVPNVASLGRRIMLLIGNNPVLEFTARRTDAGHIRYHTFDNIKQLFNDNGFKIDKLCGTVVNFCGSGKMKSKLLAKIWPELSASICVVAHA